ncbi:M12 family metallo-peptidase [Wenzhouxiangella sediminis]|uniref:Peptidase M12B domain-containing protein n=1 Tax=Wenzhouxiangella sediminis TaxID=1792836 RepID=A0A3E1K9Z5_9GAMM|nr:M12 family metallo-peptidase [Wenzhouxiangella sediminis]RFF31082.1 hypothetical protein DZC52_05695 [Wenzhouxiangella sediminis]
MPIRLICLIFLLCAGCASAVAAPAAKLNDYALLDLPSPAHRVETHMTVNAFGQRWQLSLRDNTAPFAQLSADLRERISRGGHRYMSGEVVGRPGSWVRLNWTGHRWWGAFHDGRALYLIDRAAGFDWTGRAEPAAGQDIVFRRQDLSLEGVIGHDPIVPPVPNRPQSTADRGSTSGAQSLPVTIVADTAFQATHGGNAAAIVAGRINFVDGIYTSQLGTGIVLHHLEALSDDGPLTATEASTLLGEFRDFMDGGDGSAIPFAGLAHLVTSRSRDGGIAGIAYLGVLCSSFAGYGVDWDAGNETTNGLVFAHELGHNFDAPHDGQNECADETFRGIMNPSINGSQEFSQCSLEQMQPAVAAASCLVTTPNADLIFGDGFGALP